MLTRRHIRVKALQSIYALNQQKQPDLAAQEKFLFYSIEQMRDLYLVMLQLLVSLRHQADSYLNKSQKKHLATKEEKNPSRIFLENKLLLLIEENPAYAEIIKNKKLDFWQHDSEYVAIIFKELRKKEWYAAHLAKTETNFAEDRDFVIKIYKDIVAPNEKLYDYIEDKRLTWVDDFPIVNTAFVKMLNKLTPKNVATKLLPEIYKNEDDKEFALQLLRKTVLNSEKLAAEVEGKTPNWDQERIADVDLIILKMGIAEFLYFPSIPVKATINEYLEISKEYSTPKSSIFVNGILDKLVKQFDEEKKLKKIGRGLH